MPVSPRKLYYTTFVNGGLAFAFANRTKAEDFCFRMEQKGLSARLEENLVTEYRYGKVRGCLVRPGDSSKDLESKFRPPMLLSDPSKAYSTISKAVAVNVALQALAKSNRDIEVVRKVVYEGADLERIMDEDSKGEPLHRLAYYLAQVLRSNFNGSSEDLMRFIDGVGKFTIRHSKMRMLPEFFTRYTLIDPLLSELGYINIYPESDIFDVGRQKRVDYVALINRTYVLIEAEPLGSDLFAEGRGIRQVEDYMGSTDRACVGIATDGVRWVLVSRTASQDQWTRFNVDAVDIRPVIGAILRNIEGSNYNVPMELMDDLKGMFSAEHILQSNKRLKVRSQTWDERYERIEALRTKLDWER